MFQGIELIFEAPPLFQPSRIQPHGPIFILFLPNERSPVPLGRLWMELPLLHAAQEALQTPRNPCQCSPGCSVHSEALPSKQGKTLQLMC